MKKRSIALLVCLGLSMGLVMAGCGEAKTPEKEPVKEEATVKEDKEEAEAERAEESAVEEATSQEEVEEPNVLGQKGETIDGEAASKPENKDFFKQCDGLMFTFASGAGAWSTEMTINADGSFEGLYHDSDMGDIGDKYPNGTVYVCNFTGQFGSVKKVNDYTYSTTIESVKLGRTPGEEEYADDVRYIYSVPYGIEDSKDILFYTADAPLKELPDEYRSWVWIEDESKGVLGFIGMYNEVQGEGFSSYYNVYNASTDVVVDSSLEGVAKEIAIVQAKADALENDLRTKDLSQTDMNLINSEIYTLWDNELNSVWRQLKENLDEKTMADITADEKQWIKYKETTMEDEAKDWEGGSGWAMIYYGAGAKLTRERVYYLADFLK